MQGDSRRGQRDRGFAGRPEQNADFTPFRTDALRIAILVTDALPAGFDNTFVAGTDDLRAHQLAVDAAARGIKLSAIYVPTVDRGPHSGVNATEAAIMQDYATTTNGVFIQAAGDGTGTGNAIMDIIAACGAQSNFGGQVGVDVKPTSCRNPMNVGKEGVLPVAITGSSSFDVRKIDLGTVKLEGITPLRASLEDVVTNYTPVAGKSNPFDCTTQGPDGFLDLTLKFDPDAVVAAAENRVSHTFTDGEVVVLKLTGNLTQEFGGAPFTGEDVVVMLVKKDKK